MRDNPSHGKSQLAIIVTDTSVLVNFLCIDRMDLFADYSHEFTVTDHVAAEISYQYPEQQKRFTLASATGAVSQTSVTSSEEVFLFGSLSASGRLAAGECSAITMAVHRQYILAFDDYQAAAQARSIDPDLVVLKTQDLMVSMIKEELLNIREADKIKDDWAERHRFRLNLRSFQDICS